MSYGISKLVVMIEPNNDQCVLIENEAQFKQYYHLMRSAKSGMDYKDWARTYGVPSFPVYLGWAIHPTKGRSLGMMSEPINIWTKEELEVIKF
jgi:hypothetical protein